MGRRNWTFSENCKITKVSDPSADGTSDITSSSVDMTGYQGVIFLASVTTAAADNLLHGEQSANDSDFDDLANTALGVGSSDEDLWLEINRPGDRYVRCILERGTSTVAGDIWAIQFGAKNPTVDNTTAGTIHGEQHADPSEGTK